MKKIKNKIFRLFLKLLILSYIFDLIIWLKLNSVVRIIIFYYIKFSNINIGRNNVLFISRPIFDQDIKELKKYSKNFHFIKIDKFIFTKLFYSIFNLRPNIHTGYHFFEDIKKEKMQYYYLLDQIFPKLFKKLNIRMIISSNYVYCWQQEFAKLSLSFNIPFLVLLKEGILPVSELGLAWKKYSNKKFIIIWLQ